MILALNVAILVLGVVVPALSEVIPAGGTRCGVSGNINDCSAGTTLQMCNRITNPSDMGVFSDQC